MMVKIIKKPFRYGVSKKYVFECDNLKVGDICTVYEGYSGNGKRGYLMENQDGEWNQVDKSCYKIIK